VAKISIFQGENDDTRYNTGVGDFKIEGLAEIDAGNQIIVRFDLDLSGILKVTATERLTGLAKRVTIDNAIERFRVRQRTDAVDRLEAIFGTATARETPALTVAGGESESPSDAAFAFEELLAAPSPTVQAAGVLAEKAERALTRANSEDAADLRALLTDLRSAIESGSEETIQRVSAEVEDLLFYLEDR
jgi:molecular chaperone DnaK